MAGVSRSGASEVRSASAIVVGADIRASGGGETASGDQRQAERVEILGRNGYFSHYWRGAGRGPCAAFNEEVGAVAEAPRREHPAERRALDSRQRGEFFLEALV